MGKVEKTSGSLVMPTGITPTYREETRGEGLDLSTRRPPSS